MPIIPPTIEKVEAFLKYTDRAPDERIAVLPQANLQAVPWNIAANAVMAGCRPDSMPLLIAAVEAIADNTYNLNNIGTTWGVLPFLLVNGPAAERLGIENGGQLISKGANPAIGRALGLIIKNIAGYKFGRNYMGTFGYPMNFVIAENEERESVGALPRRAWFPERRHHRDCVRHCHLGLASGDLRHARQDRRADRTRVPESRADEEALPCPARGTRPEWVSET